MKINKVETFLTVNGKILERNFNFMVITPLNSFTRKAFIRIHKLYYWANEIAIEKDEACILEIALNSGDKVRIFEGKVKNVVESALDFCIEAGFSPLGTEELNESYKGLSYKEAFLKLSDKCLYKAEDAEPQQTIFQGRKSKSFSRLIQEASRSLDKALYFWLTREGKPLVHDKIEAPKSYDIEGLLIETGTDCLLLFPIPEMEIGDKLTLKGQEYRVKSIVFDTTAQAVMICGVQRVG